MKMTIPVLLLLLLTGCGAERPPTEYQRYKEQCHNMGGFVSVVNSSWTYAEYSCISQDPQKPELLPRFRS